MECIGDIKKGFVGSAWFMGWVVSLFIVPRMADASGRKLPYLFGMFMTLGVYAGVLFCHNVNLMIAL
jgi:MFS family permease